MPTAKPRFDVDGSWKLLQFSDDKWEEMQKNVQEKLKPFYPTPAEHDSAFGHPSEGWANHLLQAACDAVSVVLWSQRLTTQELLAERKVVLATLKKAEKYLNTLSHDFAIVLGNDDAVISCHAKISKLIPHVEVAELRIKQLPRAKKILEVQREAAVEMAIGVLRSLKNEGITVAAYSPDYLIKASDPTQILEASDAVRILKIIGDEIEYKGIKLELQAATWKKIISDARKTAPDLRNQDSSP